MCGTPYITDIKNNNILLSNTNNNKYQFIFTYNGTNGRTIISREIWLVWLQYKSTDSILTSSFNTLVSNHVNSDHVPS